MKDKGKPAALTLFAASVRTVAAPTEGERFGIVEAQALVSAVQTKDGGLRAVVTLRPIDPKVAASNEGWAYSPTYGSLYAAANAIAMLGDAAKGARVSMAIDDSGAARKARGDESMARQVDAVKRWKSAKYTVEALTVAHGNPNRVAAMQALQALGREVLDGTKNAGEVVAISAEELEQFTTTEVASVPTVDIADLL